MVMNEIMEAAERLFVQQGVAGTSLQELAEAVGLTRTGIYHYIANKDDLLGLLVRDFTLDTAETLKALVDDTTRPAIERLREGVEASAIRAAEHPQRFRLLLTSEEAFPEDLAQLHRHARRDTLASLVALISEAINDGTCRPVAPELAAFSLMGISNWVAFWYPRPEGITGAPPRVMAKQLADIALGGLIVTDAEDARGGVDGALQQLQSDVARLQHLLGR